MISYWGGVTAAFGVGLGVGAAAWSIFREHKLEEEYRERTASFMRALESARSNVEVHITGDTAQMDEAMSKAREGLRELSDKLDEDEGSVIVTPGTGVSVADLEDFKPESINPYHEAVDEPAASWTYLEEEDYHDDDGRYKGQITIMPQDDGKPVFVEDDIEIADWEQKVGPSILRDFYALVPPDVHPAVLYVRNNLTQSDYEVIRGLP